MRCSLNTKENVFIEPEQTQLNVFIHFEQSQLN